MNAQTFSENKPFDVDLNIAIDIGETIQVEGTVFPVFELKSGKNFVKAISAKTGKVYPVYIYEQTKLRHKGYIVHKTLKDKYCYYKLNKSGYPYPVWLKQN
jgi:hypothetical protein